MSPFVLWVALAVAGNLLYHVSQKSVPADAPPLLSLLVTYAVAFLAAGDCGVRWANRQSRERSA